MVICIELGYTNPDPVRQERRPDHRELLRRLRDEGVLFAAGPWSDDSGGMIIFDTEDEQQARQLIADDPYCQSPGVRILSVRDWTVVVSR